VKYVYLSGPMTGIKDFNRPLFNDVAETLRSHFKWDVWNPAEHDGPEIEQYVERRKLPDHLWQEVLDKDLAVIKEKCWAVAVLPGWTESPGARAEVDHALENGLKLYHINNLGSLRYSTDSILAN
jgi:hypothetical protein